jgi:hypothetical protein
LTTDCGSPLTRDLPFGSLTRHLLIGNGSRLWLAGHVPAAAFVAIAGLGSTLARLTLTHTAGFLPAPTARFAAATTAGILASAGLALSTTTGLLAAARLALSTAATVSAVTTTIAAIAASAIAASRFAAGPALPLGRVDRGHVH